MELCTSYTIKVKNVKESNAILNKTKLRKAAKLELNNIYQE